MKKKYSFLSILIAFTIACFFLFGCDHKHDHKQKGKSPAEKHDHGHHHTAKYGGALVALGDHFAHGEILLDKSNGKVTFYVLDGEVEKSIRLEQKEITLLVSSVNDKEIAFSLNLEAVESELTGEKIGDTSQFEGSSPELINAKMFEAQIKSILIKGSSFAEVHFHFPKGNEGDHDDHDHDDHDHNHDH